MLILDSTPGQNSKPSIFPAACNLANGQCFFAVRPQNHSFFVKWVLGVFEKLSLQLKNGLVQLDFADYVDQLGLKTGIVLLANPETTISCLATYIKRTCSKKTKCQGGNHEKKIL